MGCPERGVSCSWRVAGLAVLAVLVWLLPAAARAQTGSDVTLSFPRAARAWNAPVSQVVFNNAAGGFGGAETPSIRQSLETLPFDSASLKPAFGAAGPAQGMRAMSARQVYAMPPRRMGSPDRGVVGLVLGAVAGGVLGGAVGVAVYDGSSYSDPTLRGVAVGVPIGAAIGALIGYAIVR